VSDRATDASGEDLDVAAFVRDWLSIDHDDRLGGKRHFDAGTQLTLLLHHTPYLAWWLIALLAASTTNTRLLASIGAGPLEDLIADYPEPFADLVASEVQGNGNLRTALSAVWACEHFVPGHLLERLEAACPSFRRLADCGCDEATEPSAPLT
jgi:hypothetical protein